jgi:hypothetical protein
MPAHPRSIRSHLTAILVVLPLAASILADCGVGTGPTPAAHISISATINGTAWVASTASHGVPPYATWYAWDSTLALSGTRAYGSDSSLGLVIVLHPVTGAANFPLGAQGPGSHATAFLSAGDIYAHTYKVRWYYTNDILGGSATLTTFDPATHQIAGSFSFIALDSLGQSRQVTQGQFAGEYLVPVDSRQP